MLERALILVLLALGVATAVVIVRSWSGRRVVALQRSTTDGLWSALGASPDGRPSLLVFSTPGCAVCRTAQAPAVGAVEARYGPALRTLAVDMSVAPRAATAFKVLTAPTTVVLAGDGRVLSLNSGFAPADRLIAQIDAAGLRRSPGRPARPAPPAPASAARR